MAKNQTYDVVVKEEAPFVIAGPIVNGLPTFSGFAIDVLKKVSEKAGFSYDIKLGSDVVSYGRKDEQTNNWGGLISDLESNADIAVGAIPISEDKPDFVDYSKGIWNSKISYLIKAPDSPKANDVTLYDGIGVLLEPFATEVWVMIVLAFVVISLSLFLIGRMSPYEWARISKEKDVRHCKNSFDLKNCFLFAASTLGWQGYREAPRSTSGRLLMCVWFIFTVFVLLGYTAGLCSIFTLRGQRFGNDNTLYVPFEGIKDILAREEIKLMAVRYGHVYKTLEKAKTGAHPDVSKVFDYINDSDEWTKDQNEGIQRVKDSKGKYALLLETTKAQYITNKHCDLAMYRTLPLEAFQYGIAIKKSTALKEKIDEALLALKEDGTLHKLSIRYFIDTNKCTKRDSKQLMPLSEKSSSSGLPFTPVFYSLDMKDMAAAFLFFFLGVFAAAAALGGEIYYRKWLLEKRETEKGNPPPPPIYKGSKIEESDKDKKEENIPLKPDVEIDIEKAEIQAEVKAEAVELATVEDAATPTLAEVTEDPEGEKEVDPTTSEA